MLVDQQTARIQPERFITVLRVGDKSQLMTLDGTREIDRRCFGEFREEQRVVVVLRQWRTEKYEHGVLQSTKLTDLEVTNIWSK